MTDKLRKIVREILEDEIEEVTTSAAAGPYLTPKAFGDNSKAAKAHTKRISQQAGYTLANETEEGEAVELTEAATRYHAFKNDPMKNEIQKIGSTIQEITRQLNEMHRSVRMASRLKLETATPHDKLWKRTAKHVAKMEAKLDEIKTCLQDLRT